MGTFSSVSVDDDFSSGKTGVSMGSSNNKFSGGINMEDVFIIKKGLDSFRELTNDLWNQDVPHVCADLLEHLFIITVKLVMLGLQNNGVNPDGGIIISILNGHL